MTTETNTFIGQAVRRALYGASAMAAGLALPTLSHAQTAQPAASSGALEEVVITGSRIASPNLVSVSPITAVAAEEVAKSGVTRVEDLINSLPQVVADQDSGLSMGSNGIATINLRGLGAQRTLVLMNGRRLGGGDPGATLGSAPGFASAGDINQIPVALIERVDVLTGGASSTYGADAVAGVVNFVMNDHFEGVRVDVNGGIYNHNNKQGALINPLLSARHFPTVSGTNWDGSNEDLSVILGHNFADGAGNVTAYLTYRHAAPITADHRDHAACVLDHHAPWTCAGSSNSAPTVFYDWSAGDAASYQVAPNGTILPKYARYNYAATHYLQRVDDRYTGGVFGKLKLGEHTEAYTEFTFMDDETQGAYAPAGAFLGSGQAIDAETGLVDGNMTVNCGVGGYGNSGMNPYLSQAQWNYICNYAPYTKSNVPTGAPAYQIDANGDAQLLIARRNVEGGPRQDNYSHIAYRGVFGLRGDINDNWKYDAYGLFTKVRSSQFHNNDTSTARMQNAMLAIKDANGNIVCRGGQAGCVPYNLWNLSIPVDPKSLAYFSLPGLFNATSSEDVISGYVSGDLSNSVKLPSAKDGLKVVFGIEGRRDTLNTYPDAELQTADLAGNGSPVPPVAAGNHVWEAFTEAELPITNHFDTQAGYRYSDYSAGFKTNTFKLGLSWSPIDDIRVRASYNKAVRVPNLQELYQPRHVGLDSGGDICNIYTSLSASQCALTGLGAGNYPAPASPAAQYNGLIGGTPTLKPEEGKTFTAGVQFTPEAMPGFNASIDYTDIKIDGLVNSYGPNLIQSSCIASGDANSSWCKLIHRDAGGTLWASPTGYTFDPLLNTGALENKGIDLSLGYRFHLGSMGALATRLDGSYLLKLLNSPGESAAYDCAGLFGPSCSPATPKWRHRMTADWETPHNGLSFGFTWRYFGATRNSMLEASSPDFTPGNYTDATIAAHSMFDLRAAWAVDKVTVRFGVNNAFDKDPPLIDTQNSGGNTIYAESNTYPGMYDSNGRYFFINATIDF